MRPVPELSAITGADSMFGRRRVPAETGKMQRRSSARTNLKEIRNYPL
jgi:hypothetical protein